MTEQEMHAAEAIDHVFTALRNTQVPYGMEQRILKSLQIRPVQRSRRSVAAWLGVRPWPVALACLLMAALALSIGLHRSAPLPHEIARVRAQPYTGTTVPLAQVEEEQTTHPSLRRSVEIRESSAVATKSEPVSDEDALAISEMLAPSKPAPPLPLTRQEELLAEAAHQAGPVEFSTLRPEVRAQEMELSKAEFQTFFEPPPTKNNE